MSSSLPELHLDWCSHEAAKYAVERWHYSHSMPVGKSCYVGVWEGGVFIGSLVFGCGAAAATDGRRWGLARTFDVAELERVALRAHVAPVSRIGSIAVRMIARQYPTLKLLISYADPLRGHHGGIYQAMGWVYVGVSAKDHAWKDRYGKLHHSRVVGTAGDGSRKIFGKMVRSTVRVEDCVRVELPQKYCYLWPLNEATRQLILPKAKPYPKRPKLAVSGDQPKLGGSTPTRPLHPPAVDDEQARDPD